MNAITVRPFTSANFIPPARNACQVGIRCSQFPTELITVALAVRRRLCSIEPVDHQNGDLLLVSLLDRQLGRSPKYEQSILGRGHDIHNAVAIQIHRQNIISGARAVVD